MKQEIEVSGPTVEEAISSGLRKLNLARDQVNIEVLDEGRRAILGIGGRDALVRLTPAEEPEPQPQPEPKMPEPMIVKTETATSSIEVDEEDGDDADYWDSDEEEEDQDIDDEAQSLEAETALSIITDLLDLMHVDADVSLNSTEPDDLTGKSLPVVDINGDDLGVLIGPRGETLDALQYISRLMVGHKTRQRANFVIDIEGYRQRREQALSRLAERMADKAVKRGSPVTLEAMPAYERRIIHMALRDSKDVRTESTGEGNRRRVRIYPN